MPQSTVPPDLFGACLRDLSARIDEQREQANLDAWMAFLDDRCEDDVFQPPRRTPAAPRVTWPDIHINTAYDDADAMVLSQLAACSALLADGGGLRLAVRCNYGTGIIPSLFGCDMFLMPPETRTLPTALPLGSKDKVFALLDAGVPDLRGGLGEKVFATAERFLEVFRDYPKLARHVTLYHPDTQGPIDIAEVVWGSDIFYAFYDDTRLLRDLLDLITETYIRFLLAWYDLVGPPDGCATHWGLMHKGTIMIRNDSLMNLSPQAYVEFVRPLDQRLFDQFGGGAIHFCGRGDHYIEPLSQMTGLTAINMSQPECNDMETILRHTVDKGIKLIGLPPSCLDGLSRPLRGQVSV